VSRRFAIPKPAAYQPLPGVGYRARAIPLETVSEIPKPRWLTETSLLMSITNAMGWAIIDWSKPTAHATFIVFTFMIAIGYMVIWFYWRGRNWARILVLLNSFVCLYNLRYWSHPGVARHIMIAAEAALAIFLLCWLNTRTVKEYFRDGSVHAEG
jgi:hypothetical protein